MSPDDLKKIETRTKDSLLRWNILLAQQDRDVLLSEVKRLKKENSELRGIKKIKKKAKKTKKEADGGN